MTAGRKRATHVTHQKPPGVPGRSGQASGTGASQSSPKKQGKKARKKRKERNARIREQLDERGHIVNAKTIRARLAAAKAKRDEEARERHEEET